MHLTQGAFVFAQHTTQPSPYRSPQTPCDVVTHQIMNRIISPQTHHQHIDVHQQCPPPPPPLFPSPISIPHLPRPAPPPPAAVVQPSFEQHYRHIAARKFLFFHGSSSSISLKELVNSPVLKELRELAYASAGEAHLMDNWFSLQVGVWGGRKGGG